MLRVIGNPRYTFIAFTVLLLNLLASSSNYAQSVALIEISGQVIDQQSQQPIPNVSVSIKGTVAGTVSNQSGNFNLRTRSKLPFTLVFSSVGFKQQELQVTSLGSKLQIAL